MSIADAAIPETFANERDCPAPPFGWDTPFHIGGVEIPSRFNLAPLAGYTHMPFRMTVRDLGGLGLATTDLLSARAILDGSRKTEELMATCPADRPVAVQIFGSVLPDLERASKILQDRGYPIIDINMGCPVNKVTKGGGGSALLCDTTGQTIKLVETVVNAVSIPVTVKMRLGWDARNHTAPQFARAFENVGAKAITIHGRTRAQGFSGVVDREGIRRVVEAVDSIPVVANGDIRTVADADRMIRETGCDAIAIGRGGLANPWIFRQLSNWARTGSPGGRGTYNERLDLMEIHLKRMVDWRGERNACMMFRKNGPYHCRAVKGGREIHDRLQKLQDWKTFEEILSELREQGPPPGWRAGNYEAEMHIPAGAISHW